MQVPAQLSQRPWQLSQGSFLSTIWTMPGHGSLPNRAGYSFAPCKLGPRLPLLTAPASFCYANLLAATPRPRRDPLRAHAACPGAQRDQSLFKSSVTTARRAHRQGPRAPPRTARAPKGRASMPRKAPLHENSMEDDDDVEPPPKQQKKRKRREAKDRTPAWTARRRRS